MKVEQRNFLVERLKINGLPGTPEDLEDACNVINAVIETTEKFEPHAFSSLKTLREADNILSSEVAYWDDKD